MSHLRFIFLSILVNVPMCQRKRELTLGWLWSDSWSFPSSSMESHPWRQLWLLLKSLQKHSHCIRYKKACQILGLDKVTLTLFLGFWLNWEPFLRQIKVSWWGITYISIHYCHCAPFASCELFVKKQSLHEKVD